MKIQHQRIQVHPKQNNPNPKEKRKKMEEN